MSGSLNKKVRHKKYSTIFSERVEEIDASSADRDKENKPKSNESITSLWARAIVAKRMSKKIRLKIMDRAYSCKKSLINIKPPRIMAEWNPEWGCQVLCKVCQTPALYDSVQCKYCDEVAHLSCVKDSVKQIQSNYVVTQYDDEILADGIMMCSKCKEFHAHEINYYVSEKQRLQREYQLKAHINRIVNLLKTNVIRKRYIRRKALVTVLQSISRMHFVRKKFGQWRRSLIRIVNLQLVELPEFPYSGFLIWTLIDSFKNVQLFRCDREINKSLTEGFLIPGTSGNVELFITLVKNENANLIMVGQCQLSFRDVNPFIPNQDISLVFREKIVRVPEETRNEKISLYMPMRAVDREYCQQETRKCVVRFNAMSTITSFCAFIHGPPLDVLRRPPEGFGNQPKRATQATLGPQERKTRWWLCLTEMNLLFYQFFGDTRPRFSITIEECTAQHGKDNLFSSVLLFQDRRRWVFDFETQKEVNTFIFAVNESRKAAEGTSIFFKKARSFDKISL